MQRREFLKKAVQVPVAVAVIGSSEIILTACPPFQTVAGNITSILQEVGPALQLIMSLLPLLGSKNLSTNVVNDINGWVGKGTADVTQVLNFVQQYQSDLKNNPTLQSKLNALIQTTEADIDGILNVAQVLDSATRQKIVDETNAIGSAIISAETLIAQLEGKTSAKKPRMVQGKVIFVKNGKDFKSKFNDILHAPTNDPVVDGATQQLSLK